ncbi:MAG: sigma-70 family RNA polymerase sigma factor [Rhodothermales bacterium]|nr:sigma-70 family RNA polymerase sigma factor [Rhodothermales bacterium]
MVNLEQYEAAVAEHRDRVFGFALHFLGDREEAEDVTQDVLIRLWCNRDNVAIETLTPWLLRVARNACVDQYRKRRTRDQNREGSPDATEKLVSQTTAPDRSMDNDILREQIVKSVNELREPYKSIVVLREMQQMTYEEIGSALDLPLTTVKVYLHRGRRKLRESLKKLYDDFADAGLGVNQNGSIGASRQSVHANNQSAV